MPLIGIDLGTTNSVVAYRKKNGTVDVLCKKLSEKIIPSYASFLEKKRVFESFAKNKTSVHPTQTVYAVKQSHLRKFDDVQVQSDIRDKNYAYDIVDTCGGIAIEADCLSERSSSLLFKYRQCF